MKVLFLLGPSGSGKDTIKNILIHDYGMNTLIPYTTRIQRINEIDGVDYFFVNEAGYRSIKDSGKILEERAYETVHGLWRYFHCLSEDLEQSDDTYIAVGTTEACLSFIEKLGKDNVLPVYIYVDPMTRIQRSLEREAGQSKPNVREVCRRFLSDYEINYNEEILSKIDNLIFVRNYDMLACAKNVYKHIIGQESETYILQNVGEL